MKTLTGGRATSSPPDPTRRAAGDVRGLVRLGNLTRTWHTFRTAVAAGALALSLPLGIVWRWPGGLAVAVMAALALIDARQRLCSPTATPTFTMLLDAALIGVALLVVGLEPAGVWAPLLYMLAIPVLMLPWRRAVPVMLYSAAWSALVFANVTVLEPPEAVVDSFVTVAVTVLFGGYTLALLGAVAHELDRSHRARELRVRYERALAKCGEALLASTEEGAIDVALEALLAAVPAQNIFVDKNFDDPDLGLCARVTHEVIRPGYEDLVDEEIWVEPDAPETVSRTVLPYSDMPTSYAALSTGRASVIVTSQLTGSEREIYDDDGCLSEVNIPIMVAGEWVGSIGLADYVTEREWSEDDLRVLHTAAAMIGAFWERNSAYKQLEELIRSKDEFLASISHEIRTPLTAVLGFSEILDQSTSEFTAEDAAHLALITEQAQEVADIVEDLLVAARADIDALAVTTQYVDLRQDVARVLAARDLQTTNPIHIEGDGATAWADPSRVRQIIRCLVSNAARYGGDHIEIHIEEGADRACLAVIDDGEGIPVEHHDQVFDAYHRAHTRDGRPQAIGLGLYVARHLARLMGGNLTHRRERGLTVFELELPVPPGTTAAELPDVARSS